MGDDLIWAIKNGDQSSLEEIVEKEGSVINQEINGRLPLHYAADYGHADVISYLLTKGADINRPDKYGITPLLAAIYEGHVACVKLLIEKGAAKNGAAPGGESYIDCAETEEIKQLLK